MKRLARIVLLAAALPLAMSGCEAVLIGTAVQSVTGALTRPLEVRPVEEQIRDTRIHTNLLRQYVDVDPKLPADVTTDVWEGRVMLTGVVDEEAKREAVQHIARGDERVREVHNHILVGTAAEVERNRTAAKTKPPEESRLVAVNRFFSDLWIETQIKTRLVVARGVGSVNYRWHSVRNNVYIIGRARTEEEKARVVQIISETKGVRKVVEHIEVAPGGVPPPSAPPPAEQQPAGQQEAPPAGAVPAER